MLFTRVGRIIAWLVLIFALFRIGTGAVVLTGYLVELEPGRFLGYGTPAEAIDEGLFGLAFAFILGVLTEISSSIYSATKAEEQ